MAGVAVIWLVIIGTSIWVAVDASNIGARVPERPCPTGLDGRHLTSRGNVPSVREV
jgi:hypothetical protein